MAPALLVRYKSQRISVSYLFSLFSGKSALILQYLENQFVENYYPTIEGSFQRCIKYNGTEYDCEIIDTAGQVSQIASCPHTPRPDQATRTSIIKDEYSLVNAKHTIGTHGYIFVYSVASRNSFDVVKVLYDRVLDFSGFQQVPCVIVGSKSDLDQL